MKKVAIIGSGKIAIDLMIKIKSSAKLDCVLISGRNRKSEGLEIAKNNNIKTAFKSIDSILEIKNDLDLVFDATSAHDHRIHWNLLKKTNLKVIDMTPSNIGYSVVPAINLNEAKKYKNINMISCGGQSSLPLIYRISQLIKKISYVELVSSIASESAGMGTRVNIDEYIHNTRNAIRKFTSLKKNKVILILNPAKPPIVMQNSLSFLLNDDNIDIISLVSEIEKTVSHIKTYVPGYDLIYTPKLINKRLILSVRVEGNGDYLPKFAGNLDIINNAAIKVAEEIL